MPWRVMTVVALLVASTLSPSTASVVAQDQNVPVQQLVVYETAPIYSNDGDEIGEVSPADSYTVLAIEEGSALVVGSDPDADPFWIELDSRVEVLTPVAQQPPPPTSAPPQPSPTAPPAGAPAPTATALPIPPAVSPPPAVSSRDPAAWSLTVADLPGGFTMDVSERQEDADYTSYQAVFNPSDPTLNRPGPFGVMNQLATLKLPPGVTLRQEFIDQIADDYQIEAYLYVGSARTTTNVTTTPGTRVSGPTIGELTRWHRVAFTQQAGGLSSRAELHLVAFAVGNNVAVIATLKAEGMATQADTANFANIVLGRMRG